MKFGQSKSAFHTRLKDSVVCGKMYPESRFDKPSEIRYPVILLQRLLGCIHFLGENGCDKWLHMNFFKICFF